MKNKIIKLLLYFLTINFIQILFAYIAFNHLYPNNILFSLTLSLVISLIMINIDSYFPHNGKWFNFAIVLFFSIYAIVQLNFKAFMGNYISLNQGVDGATRITSYIIEFIKFIKPHLYLFLLAPLMMIIINMISIPKPRHNIINNTTIICLLTISLCIQTYLPTTNISQDLASSGPIASFIIDIINLFNKPNQELIITENKPIITATPDTNNKRIIDDTQWNEAITNEQDKNILAIDNYLKQQPLTTYNDYTGIFKGKNLIYIMIEAFDYMAIDKDLTPTLYKLKNEGWFFDNYYAPKYSCTTGESEFIGLTSIVPENNTCAPNDYRNNLYPGNIFTLFNSYNYTTTAYHNWKDEFYERRTLYANMGASAYYNYDDFNFTLYKGWPSDIELFNYAYDIFSQNEPFMAHIVTSTTHFPYDTDSWSADLNLDKINSIHPDYPLEVKRYLSKAMILDEGLNQLLTNLQNDNKLEDTVLVLFADHHPLKTDKNIIETYSYLNRTDNEFAIDKSPFIIYNANQKPQTFSNLMSTFDILPTILNMFDIDHDPRIYSGSDYFSNIPKMAIFANGGFVINEGYYSSVDDKFTLFEDKQLSNDQINNYKIIAQNKINVSSSILRLDYFKHRYFNEN